MNKQLKAKIINILILLRFYRPIAYIYGKIFRTSKSQRLKKFSIVSFDRFIDGNMNKFLLLKGFRDFITPEWENMYNFETFTALDLSNFEVESYLKNANNNILSMEKSLEKFEIKIKDKVILDIGCYAGGALSKLINKSPQKLVGIDISSYYITQTKNAEINNDTTKIAQKKLDELRKYVFFYDHQYDIPDNIVFLEDNIIDSKLSDNSFDLILSWEVLEHIKNPKLAFAEMYRLLKPGGVMFHHYNPFFSINGGHSLCTLDFPWGHCCVSNEEFSSYMKKFRPDERIVAEQFFNNSLNRMTIRDLFSYLEEYNFRVLEIKYDSWSGLNKFFSNKTFEKTSSLYPSIMVNDLYQTAITVIAKKQSISTISS